MMLYTGGTIVYPTSTSTTTTAGDDYYGDHTYSSHCRCPNCGNVHRCRVEYVTSYDTDFGFKEEPLPRQPRFVFPRPTNQAPLPHFDFAPIRPARRSARAMGHRGSFRNFHKIKN